MEYDNIIADILLVGIVEEHRVTKYEIALL